MLGLIFSSELDYGSYMISIAKTPSKKIGALIYSRKLLLLRLLCVSINLPYNHAWNTVTISELVLLVATCRYARLLVLRLLPPLNPWLIAKM